MGVSAAISSSSPLFVGTGAGNRGSIAMRTSSEAILCTVAACRGVCKDKVGFSLNDTSQGLRSSSRTKSTPKSSKQRRLLNPERGLAAANDVGAEVGNKEEAMPPPLPSPSLPPPPISNGPGVTGAAIAPRTVSAMILFIRGKMIESNTFGGNAEDITGSFAIYSLSSAQLNVSQEEEEEEEEECSLPIIPSLTT